MHAVVSLTGALALLASVIPPARAADNGRSAQDRSNFPARLVQSVAPMTSRTRSDRHQPTQQPKQENVRATGHAAAPIPLKRTDRGTDVAVFSKDDDRGPTGSLWTAVAATAFILLLILGGARLLKKHVPLGNATLPQEAFEVVGKRHLDPRQRVYVVRFGRRILLIGSYPDGMTTLAEITDPVEVDQLTGLCRQTDPDSGVVQTFRQLFNARDSQSVPPSPSAIQAIAAKIDSERLARGHAVAASGPPGPTEATYGR